MAVYLFCKLKFTIKILEPKTKTFLKSDVNEFRMKNKILKLGIYFFNLNLVLAESNYTDCNFVYIKEPTKPNCVIEEYKDQELQINIYDYENESLKNNSEKIIIPTEFNLAKLRFEDWLGEGRKMIIVELESNKQKFEKQKLLIIFRWHKEMFKPVFFETISYDKITGDEKNNLTTEFKFQDFGTKRISLFLEYNFERSQKKTNKPKEKKNWTNELVWDYRNQTFYDFEQEKKKSKNAKFYIEKKIHELRLEFPIFYDKTNLDYKDEFEKSKIYSILAETNS